ncbi:uncharacterized protein LOC119579586 [Penaeus monodon]|uniref:uncharacterized protein LOC119569547 n=1 Tax=Penaeus monodon TaxID=6687 RepID=UPI0018A7554C|nr:uncharacterized protein LOC119569547 [Penaeus monodon]XP_037783440.1 uncharacterized protein LOC119579586 [Penaeus monodon]
MTLIPTGLDYIEELPVDIPTELLSKLRKLPIEKLDMIPLGKLPLEKLEKLPLDKVPLEKLPLDKVPLEMLPGGLLGGSGKFVPEYLPAEEQAPVSASAVAAAIVEF